MAELKYRIMFTGDDHLSSRNYGGHYNYPKESLHYFNLLTDIAKQYGVTHWIGLGDFTYGRFGSDLAYRKEVEEALEKQMAVVNGERYMIKGNHDTASSGMTEYEFYAGKMFKTSCDLEIDNLIIHMKDFGDISGVNTDDGKTHVIATHGFFTFESTPMNFMGEAVKLDRKADWFGVPYIICGHIHEEHVINGMINNGKEAYRTVVHYLPCLSRPQYHGEATPETGAISFIDVYDDGSLQYNRHEIELLPIGQCFNVQQIEEAKENNRRERIDLSDITRRLADREISIGNPEDLIMGMSDIKIEYRKKAVELLKEV